MSTEEQITSKIMPLIWLSLAIIVALCAIGGASYYLFPSWEIRGQFGDSFGVTSSLFSGLAFAALIYTVNLQRKELSLQRRELELTRNEIKRSALAQEASERSLSNQANALEVAARLNALSSVIDHYSIKIKSLSSATQKVEAEQKQLHYINELESILRSLEPPDKKEAL